MRWHGRVALAGVALLAAGAIVLTAQQSPTGQPAPGPVLQETAMGTSVEPSALGGPESQAEPPLPAAGPNADGEPAPAANPDPAYRRPDWMTALIDGRVADGERISACAHTFGVCVSVLDDGEVLLPRTKDPQVQAARQRILAMCCRQVRGAEPLRDLDYWRVQYDRMVELAECIEHQGYRVAPPPPREEWAAAMAAGDAVPWNPGTSLLDARLNPTAAHTPAGEQVERVCPVGALIATWR